MKYNFTIEADCNSARLKLNYFIGRKRRVEIKEIRDQRTLPQNSYLHLIIGAFGVNFGYTLEEAKTIYKEVNKHIYFYEKKGRVFVRSSADLDKDEMRRSIDTFRAKSEEQGFPLPLATDTDWLNHIENLMEQSREYL